MERGAAPPRGPPMGNARRLCYNESAGQKRHPAREEDTMLEKLIHEKGLTETEAAVLHYLVANLDSVLGQGVRGVARANFTSTSTIMRLARKMGYAGFVDMCYKLRTLVEVPNQTEQEEADFLNNFGAAPLLNYNTYTQVKRCARQIIRQQEETIFIYGTGFSGTVGEYLYRKLINMGRHCLYANAADSVGIFENSLDRMGMFFGLSKSGETALVRDKIKTAQENGVFTVAITGDQENSVGQFADIWFRVEDLWKLDDLNVMPNTFFPQTMMLVELIAYEYRRLCKMDNDGPA